MKKLNLRRRSLIVAALLAAVSVGAGTAGTVAFFQSNHTFDISVEAATVDVEQRKPKLVSTNVHYGAVIVNDDGSVGATSLVPGDTFLLKVSYVNHSNIGVKYRVSAQVPTGFTAEFFTDEACTTAASDTSYTELAKERNVAEHYVKVTVTDDLKEGYTGKITVGVDAVQDNALIDVASADELTTKIAEGGTIDLTANVDLAPTSAYTITKDTVLDLNGKTLNFDVTTAKEAFLAENGKTLTIKNGDLNVKNGTGDVAALQAIGGNLVLDNVNYVTDTTGLKYSGKDSYITIRNSNLDISGWYGIATNASESGQTPSGVDISGTTLKVAIPGDIDSAAICFNVGGTYSISDSTIIGDRQVIVLRSGDLALNNVTINKNADLGELGPDQGTFGTGNEVPQAGLFLGNGTNDGYSAPSKVTFAGPVTFEGEGPAIVASGSTTQDVDLETGIYYKGDVKVYDFRAEGDTHTFKINGKDIAIGTYGHTGSDKVTIA